MKTIICNELPAAEDVRAARSGPPADSAVLPGETTVGVARTFHKKFLLAVMLTALAFGWTSWNLLCSPQMQSTTAFAIASGLSAGCLLAWTMALRSLFGLRNIVLENTRTADANDRLTQERDLLRMVIDNLPDFIYAKDADGRFILNNRAHIKSFGASSAEELAGKTDFDVHPHELATQFYADEKKIIETGEPILNQEQCKPVRGDATGKKRWALSSKVLWRNRNGEILGTVGISRDIHEFKLVQEALRLSEEKLRKVMRHTRCILNSGEVEAPEGWRERALDAISPFRWNFPVQNVEAAQEVFPLDLADGQPYQHAWSESRNPDDFILLNQTSGGAFLNDAQYYRNEFRATDKLGVEHWMQQFVTVQKQTENRWHFFGITTDITDLKKTEGALRASEEKLRLFTAQLERSNRELQDFAYVASHDLQEPLRKIVVFGDRLKEKNNEALGTEGRDYLERMQKAASRMQNLINDLLTFSRVTTKARAFAPVNLAEVAHEVLADLEGRIEMVKGRVELGSLPTIDAEPVQMRQLLQNLIGNALKFRRDDEPPVVKVAAEIISAPSPQAAPGAPVVNLCQLTVTDNGIGFDEKYLDRIFNVFQRLHTRNQYEGTGMGLAITRKIALFHGGEITAKSKPGHGATFIVTLPMLHPKEAPNE